MSFDTRTKPAKPVILLIKPVISLHKPCKKQGSYRVLTGFLQASNLLLQALHTFYLRYRYYLLTRINVSNFLEVEL